MPENRNDPLLAQRRFTARGIAAPDLIRAGLAVAILLTQGCAMPRQVTVHDGLDTVVTDAVSKAPIQQVFVVAFKQCTKHGCTPLAYSDAAGRLRLEPEWEIKMIPLMGEALVPMALAVCKEGYRPRIVAVDGGSWNADLRAPRLHALPGVELQPADPAQTDTCAHPFRDLFGPQEVSR